MMTNFREEMISTLKEMGKFLFEAEGIHLEETKTAKPGRGELTGIVFRRNGDNSAPVFYLEDMYDMYTSGQPMEAVAKLVLDKVMDCMTETPEFPDLTTLKLDGSNLSIRLVDVTRNMPKNILYKEIGAGLAITAHIDIGSNNKCRLSTTALTRGILEMLDQPEDAIFFAALNGAQEKFAAYFGSAYGLLTGDRKNFLVEEPEPKELEDMLVLSSANQYMGASVIAYPGLLDKVRRIIGDFYILPSSVHELIVLPVSVTKETAALLETVQSTNTTVCAPDEILSNDIFLYNRRLERITREALEKAR